MYLILLDKEGKRITSLAVGIHGNTIEELKILAKKYNPYLVLEGDEKMQSLACANTYYDNGEFKPLPPQEPTLEQLKQEIKNEYAVKFERLLQAKNASELMGRSTDAIAKAYQNLIKEQKERLDKVAL